MNDTLDLNRYVLAAWRAKWLLLGVTLLAAAGAAIKGFAAEKTFTATALLEVGRVWDRPVEDLYATSEIAGSAAFLSQIDSNPQAARGIQNRVTVETISVGPRRERYPALVRINARNDNPDSAERLAQRVAQAIIERHDKLFAEAIAPYLERQQQLETRLQEIEKESSPAARDLRFRIEGELAEVRAKNTSSAMTEKTHLIGPITVDQGVRPSPWRMIATASLLALAASLAAVFIYTFLRGVTQSTAVGGSN